MIGSTRRNPAVAAAAVAASVLLAACGNPFAPKQIEVDPGEGPILPPAQEATEPKIVMDNLERAFNERDKNLYETLLDERYLFTEEDCLGNLVLENGREEELEIMGTRDGSSRGIFDLFRTVEWKFQLIERKTELGRDHPMAFEGDPDGHPDEDWEVFRGRVEILLLKTADDGFLVKQTMTFKLRQGDDGIWRIVRWIDDPLVGDDCGGGEPEEESPKAGPTLFPSVSWPVVKTAG